MIRDLAGTIAVLVVDDSATARQATRTALEADPSFRVSCANDPYEAVEALRKSVPSAIVLDVDMPRMDGLTFLRKLMRQHPLPVVLCTDHPERGLAGLELGAREVIAKPDWRDAGGLSGWGERLREAVGLAVGRKPVERPAAPAGGKHSADVILPPRPYSARNAPADRIIAIGASTGGVHAIPELLRGIPKTAPGLVIVQHMSENFTATFAAAMARDERIALRVIEAGQDEPIRPGVALVVPGHAHGVIRRHGVGYRLELVDGPPVSRHKPSVDVLFRSTAQAAGPKGLAVILTGMLDDGAVGMREVFDSGGHTIAQDEATSVVFGMPREAIRLGGARQVLALDRIAAAIAGWSSGR